MAGVAGPTKGDVLAAQIVQELKQIVAANVPYVYAGESMSGFDCSGLVQYVFAKRGINLPRTSEGQFTVGQVVQHGQLAPGDLVFSQWPGDDSSPGHVAIYVGGDQIVEAPHTGEDVHQIPLDAGYLAHVVGYRRVTGVTLAPTPPGSGGNGGDSGGGGLFSIPGDIIKFFTDGTAAITKTTAFFSAFFQPSTYVRIGAGALGSIAVIGGLVFLILAAGDA